MPSWAKSCRTSNRSRGCWRSIAATSLPPYTSSRETTGISRSACSVSRAFYVSDAIRTGRTVPRMTKLTSILTSTVPRRTSSLVSGIRRDRRMGLEALLLQTHGGLADSFVDALERLLTRQRVVGKHWVEVDREPRHVAHEEIDRRAALERGRVVDEHEWRDAHQQPCAVEIDLVHGFSTRSPSPERDTHGRS